MANHSHNRRNSQHSHQLTYQKLNKKAPQSNNTQCLLSEVSGHQQNFASKFIRNFAFIDNLPELYLQVFTYLPFFLLTLLLCF